MTEIKPLSTSEVAGSAATSIARLERILRNLREKRAEVLVARPFSNQAPPIFFSRHRRMRQKMCEQEISAKILSLKFVVPNSNNLIRLTFDPSFCVKRPANFD
jgi:hypothetical protein